jgi:hypothetical protein
MINHLGVAKAWAMGDTTGTLSAGSGISSITDVGTGKFGFNFSTSFSSTTYCALAIARGPTAGSGTLYIANVDNGGTVSAARCDIVIVNGSTTAVDPNNYYAAFFGDQ